MTIRIAVLISGTGTNLRAILDAVDGGTCAAEVCLVASDKKKAKGLELARERGVTTEVVRLADFESREVWDQALTDVVAEYRPELVVLAGFMKVVGTPLVKRFQGRIINVHPSLLPAFPGARGPALALEAGVRLSGCTVHVVDHGVDSGPIIAQAAVPVLPNDDVAQLHARIQHAEHRLLPAVIDALGRGRIELGPRLRVPATDIDERMLFSPPLGALET